MHCLIRLRKRNYTFATLIGVIVSLLSLYLIKYTINYADEPKYTLEPEYISFNLQSKLPKFKILIESNKQNKEYANKFKAIVHSKKPNWDYQMETCTDCKKMLMKSIANHFDGPLFMLIQFETISKLQVSIDTTYQKHYEVVWPYMFLLAFETLSNIAEKETPYNETATFDFVSYMYYEVEDLENASKSKNKEKITAGTFMIFSIVCVMSATLLFLIDCKIFCCLKESFFNDFLFRNGMSSSAVWSSNFIFCIFHAVLFSILCMIVIEAQSINMVIVPVRARNALFIYLFAFSMNIASVCFLLTILIRTHIYVTLVALGIAVLTAAMTLLRSLVLENNSYLGARDAMLVWPLAHASAVLTQANLGRSYDEYDEFTLNVFITTCVFPVILAIITFYLDNIVVNGNGLKLNWGYILELEYWNPKKTDFDNQSNANEDESSDDDDEENDGDNDGVVFDRHKYVEKVQHLLPVLVLRKICKTYVSSMWCKKTKFRAVKSLSAKVYENQITCLLGHNGAGKSSLISILIGKEVATNGSATIDGIEITNSIKRLSMRNQMGVCEQFDCFCPYLTVAENMEITIAAKSIPMDEDQAIEIIKLCEDLEMKLLLQTWAKSLSGGQKRKLSTMMALVGNPRIVYLDEPTSGMDPVARRCLWQVLQKYKKGRGIVLSTHFMDEADIVSERKIFMSAGRVMCAGSSMFLKNVFNCGTVINIAARSVAKRNVIFQQLQLICSELYLKRAEYREMEVQIPVAELSKLPALVTYLEKCKSQQYRLCKRYGLSQPTLDDVFMKLKEIEDALNSSNNVNRPSTFNTEVEIVEPGRSHRQVNTHNSDEDLNLEAKCKRSFVKQFLAQFFMSVHRLKRQRMKLVSRVLLPACMIGLLMVSGVMNDELQDIMKSFRKTVRFGASYRILSNDLIRAKAHKSDEKEFVIAVADENDVIGVLPLPTVTKPINKTLGAFLKDSRSEMQHILVTSTKGASQSANVDILNSLHKPFLYISNWQNIAKAGNTLSIGKIQLLPRNIPYATEFSASIINILDTLNSIGKKVDMVKTTTFNLHESEIILPYKLMFVVDMRVVFFLLLMAILPVSYMSDPIEDKQTGVKEQLIAMGLSSLTYWSSTLLLHFIQYATFFLIATILLTTWIMKTEMMNINFICIVFLPIIFVGIPGNLLFMYFIGSLFDRPQTSLSLVLFFIQVSVAVGSIAMQLSDFVFLIIPWLWPPFASMQLIISASKMRSILVDDEKTKALTQQELNEILLDHEYFRIALIAMFVHLLVFAFLLWFNEFNLVSKVISRIFNSDKNDDSSSERLSDMDDGFVKELQRLEENESDEDVIKAMNMSKVYPDGTHALTNISFGARCNEVLALLGPSGAGKTTTLSLTVGEIEANHGSLTIQDTTTGDMLSGTDAARVGAIGYCPQHNPLFNEVTVEQHIRFYAKIRGVVGDDFEDHVNGLIQHLSLEPHREKQACQLSGGNKRRLCLAISLLGNPSAVVVDEASTGVDPGTMRSIWNSIRGIVNEHRTVLITTHSMEEVEALATRVAIIHRGRMVAFGTVQELKYKFGQTYTLEILLDVSDAQLQNKSYVRELKKHAITYIQYKFKKMKILENLMSTIQIEIPKREVTSLPDSLTWLSKNMTNLGIKYYGMYQASLDQIFVNLIRAEDSLSGMTDDFDDE